MLRPVAAPARAFSAGARDQVRLAGRLARLAYRVDVRTGSGDEVSESWEFVAGFARGGGMNRDCRAFPDPLESLNFKI